MLILEDYWERNPALRGVPIYQAQRPGAERADRVPDLHRDDERRHQGRLRPGRCALLLVHPLCLCQIFMAAFADGQAA